VPPHGNGRSKRKRESVDDGGQERGSWTSSRTTFGRPRPETGVAGLRREDTAKIKEREREQDTARPWPIHTRARPDACAAQAQQWLPVAAAVAMPPTVFSVDGRPLQEQDYTTESFEEAALRRREIQRMREEARREMDKVVQTVYFNDPYISPLDVFKP
jgi:hypothetical protein